MTQIVEILQSKAKPKEKQARLVEAVLAGHIPIQDLIAYFESAKGVDKGACADAFKHISLQQAELLFPYIDLLIEYINDPLPRVKWGVPEAIGNLAQTYPEQAAKAIPNLMKNTTDEEINSTVIKWCAAYALAEIAKYHAESRQQLEPLFEELIQTEQNSGVKNVYLKALKAIR